MLSIITYLLLFSNNKNNLNKPIVNDIKQLNNELTTHSIYNETKKGYDETKISNINIINQEEELESIQKNYKKINLLKKLELINSNLNNISYSDNLLIDIKISISDSDLIDKKNNLQDMLDDWYDV